MKKRDRRVVVEQALAWVLHLSVRHLLSHRMDEGDLSLAIELLKTIRDEPDRLPLMFERWSLEADEARADQAALVNRIAAMAPSTPRACCNPQEG